MEKIAEPAFPRPNDDINSEFDHVEAHYPGMTLRDYFAGRALAGMNILSLDQSECQEPERFIKMAAVNAYLYADAMLAAREGAK